MGVSNLFKLYGILLPNGSWINRLQDLTPSANIALFTGRSAGGVAPDFRGGFGAVPSVAFSTPQIKTVLDAAGISGYDMSGGNCDLYYRAETNLGGPAALAATAHLRVRCVRAILYWTMISARQDGPAQIACVIIPTYDGTVVPMTPLDDQALPGCALAQEYFTLGPVGFNSSVAGGLEGWNLELNPTVRILKADGQPYASWCGIEDHTPDVVADTTEIEFWDTVGLSGKPLTAFAAYLRRLKPDETGPYADGESQHIKISATSGLVTPERGSGGIDGQAMLALRFGLRRSDCSASSPLTVATASAIT